MLAYADLIRAGVARWVDCGARLAAFLDARPASRGALAVYGAGVFGSFLTLQAGAERDAVACYLDQNPFKAGTVAPRPADRASSRLAPRRHRLLVGLNPGRARTILAQAGLSERSGLRFFFP